MNQRINQMDLHTHTIASGHAYATLTEMAKAASQIPGLKLLGITDHAPGTVEQNTAAVIGAISHPHIHLISHPDDGSVPLDYKAVVLAAKEHHTLLEVNNNSIRSEGPNRPGVRQNVLTMLSLCKQYQVPVVMSSDAHFQTDIGNFASCLSVLQQADFPDELIMNYDMEKMLKYIGISEVFAS